MKPVMTLVGEDLRRELVARASLVDSHTLAELARMGHPYRLTKGQTFGSETKGGQWRAGIRSGARQLREFFLGHDIKLVHKQSGDLLAAIYHRQIESDDMLMASVGVDAEAFPAIEYIVKGTRKMIPRDFIGAAAVAAKPQMFRRLREGIKSAFAAR